MGARIAPPFMEATDASRLVCVVVVSYQEYSLTRWRGPSAELGGAGTGHPPLGPSERKKPFASCLFLTQLARAGELTQSLRLLRACLLMFSASLTRLPCLRNHAILD